MIVLPVYSENPLPEWITFELQGEVDCKEAQKEGESLAIGALTLAPAVKTVQNGATAQV